MIEDVRSLALSLAWTTEALVRRRVKFRVGRIVYVAFSHDETVMGFACSSYWSSSSKLIRAATLDLRTHRASRSLAGDRPAVKCRG